MAETLVSVIKVFINIKLIFYKNTTKIICFLLVVIILTASNKTILAQTTPNDNRRAIMSGTQYFDSNDVVCTSNSANPGALEGTNTPGDIYNSGISGPYILEQFAVHILKRLSQKYNQPESNFLTEQHVIALVAFSIGEGGDIMNKSVFNPMNLGYEDNDVAPVAYAGSGGDGRQAYPSFDQGVEAYARQMSKGFQSRMGTVLSDPNSTAEDFMHAVTYYKEYEGNAFWAEASLANPEAYYNERVNLIRSVESNYSTTAALVIGTNSYEQKDKIYNTNLIQFKDLLNGKTNITSPSSSTNNICQNVSQGSASGQTIAEVANREFEKNKGILEYGGDILKYTDGNKEAWCADFVSWVYKDAGSPFSGGLSGGWRRAGVLDLQQYIKNNYTYFEVGKQTPQPGDIAFYIGNNTADGGSTQHVNIVYSVDTQNNSMVTIGGNESNQIRQNSQKIIAGEKSLVGFGRIK